MNATEALVAQALEVARVATQASAEGSRAAAASAQAAAACASAWAEAPVVAGPPAVVRQPPAVVEDDWDDDEEELNVLPIVLRAIWEQITGFFAWMFGRSR